MQPVIQSLILRRFRSVPVERIELDNPTFFVGRNGSGKSNIADAFAFLAECLVSPLQAVFDRRGGIASVRNRTSGRSYPPNIGIGVSLGNVNGLLTAGRYAFEVRALPDYGFEVVREQCVAKRGDSTHWFDRRVRTFASSVGGLRPELDPTSLALPIIGGDDRFAPVARALASMRVYAIQPSKLREMQDPDSGLGLRSDGGNAASVLQEIRRRAPKDADQIDRVLSAIVPSTKTARPIKHGQKLALEFTQEWSKTKRLKFEAFNMSDGTLRALGLLTAVYQHPKPTLMVIEEPESTIHPGALDAVLDLIQIAAASMQVVVTTHSPELLDAKWIEDRHLRVVDWQDGATRAGPIEEAARKALQSHLMGAGELLRANSLGAAPLFDESPLQGDLFVDAR